MINALKDYLKPLLKAEGFKLVESSYEVQPDDVKQVDQLPALIITRGDGTGGQSTGDSRVCQRMDRNIEMHLKCDEIQVEGLIEILFRYVLGWQFNPYWSGINYFSDEVVGQAGSHIWIVIRLGTWVTAKQGQYYNGPDGPGRNLPQP